MSNDSAERRAFLLEHAASLASRLLASREPSHDVSAEYLRRRKSLAPEEKRFIVSWAYATLRVKPLADHLLGHLLDRSDSRFPFAPRKLTTTAAATVLAVMATGVPLEGFLPATVEKMAYDREVADACSALLSRVLSLETETARDLVSRALAGARDIIRRADTIIAQASAVAEQDADILAAVACVPPWMLRSWAEHPEAPLGWARAYALGASLRNPAPVCLRVNAGVLARDEALAILEKTGYRCKPASIAPAGIVCEERVDVRRIPSHVRAALEFQDEGSQLVSYALAPAEDWVVLDACAGAGGKTLHLAELGGPRCRIVAADTEKARLEALARRAHRAGVRNIEVVLTRHEKTRTRERRRKLPPTYHAVLVDAPCSGIGRARRDPLVKFRVNPGSLERLSRTQRRILEEVAGNVLPDGILVYATCSLMAAENESVVRHFLSDHPEFVPDDLESVFARQGIEIPGLERGAWHIRLTPAEHGTDGFFIARMRRAT
ncbi:MAG: RsmB/NOP family class I SAM-dependent RNA methyltransferase [Bacteroidota bacterium]|nr:RsmB/NOP family class I SAM-dependent RNA methyltransferase [Bacteroidota bacterium]